MMRDFEQQELLLKQIVRDEQMKMMSQLKFLEVFIPSHESPASCNIFMSPNWRTCDRLLLIVVSGRGIQPGIWSRSLVLESEVNGSNSSCRSGSMLPYLQTALLQGYGVIVTNPNTNTFCNGVVKIPIPYSNTPEIHVTHVYETYVMASRCSQVYILAYGRGGVLAKHLISDQASLRPRLAAIAFVESSHRLSMSDGQDVKDLIQRRAINWKRSHAPFGQQLQDGEQLGCLSLSAGEPIGEQTSSNTAWTITASMNTVFAFFETARHSLPSNETVPGQNSFDSTDDVEMVEEGRDENGRRNRSMVISTSMTANDFDLLSVVGKGAYGKVFLAKKKSGKNEGRIYAMKVLKKKDVFRKNQVEHTRSEQRILKHIEHPFVVRLRYAFQSDQKLYLVMDYYNGGSLFFHLRRNKRFSQDRAKFYAAQLLLGIAHLHSLHIMYRDLKLENILMDSQGNIALTDFGLSKEDDEGSTFVGTPEYLAPELLHSRRTSTSYGKSVDWWSYGVLVYEMIRGQTPFFDRNRRQMFQNILTADPVFPEELFSMHARSFLQCLLVKNPQHRLGCGGKGPIEIMEHPWFHGVDWSALLEKKLVPPFQPDVGMSLTDTRYVPSTFHQQDVADSPISESFGTSGPGRQNMHFEDFSYMGSDIMGSRSNSVFRENDVRLNGS